MDSFIIIEGPVLWLLVLVFMCFVVMFLVAVNKWLTAEQENERKDMLIKKLRADNNELLGYAVNNSSECVMRNSELGRTKYQRQRLETIKGDLK